MMKKLLCMSLVVILAIGLSLPSSAIQVSNDTLSPIISEKKI